MRARPGDRPGIPYAVALLRSLPLPRPVPLRPGPRALTTRMGRPAIGAPWSSGRAPRRCASLGRCRLGSDSGKACGAPASTSRTSALTRLPFRSLSPVLLISPRRKYARARKRTDTRRALTRDARPTSVLTQDILLRPRADGSRTITLNIPRPYSLF